MAKCKQLTPLPFKGLKFSGLENYIQTVDQARNPNYVTGQLYHQWRHHTWAIEVFKLPECRLDPPPSWNILVKNLAANCAKFLNFDRFCCQKSVNNVCKLLQLQGDFHGAAIVRRASNSVVPPVQDRRRSCLYAARLKFELNLRRRTDRNCILYNIFFKFYFVIFETAGNI